ncbi:MAG: hypothetical protein WA211_05995 [Candidatus Acidiferrales bacterium]|jgi:hypothetical protein
MTEEYSNERVVVAHTAESSTEAMVIRSLLESAGIASPGSVSSDPFPIPENPEGPHNLEIQVLESQADEARKVIAEYLAGNATLTEDTNGSDDSSN